MPVADPCLIRASTPSGEVAVRLGLPLVDLYLEFVAGRCRPNTLLAVAFDLKVFFTAVPKEPAAVTSSDVLAFLSSQRAGGDGHRLRAVQDGKGLSSRTVARRLSSVSGLFAFLVVRGDVSRNPVPRGLPTRREQHRPRQTVPLVRTPRTLPRVLSPAEVHALLGALRTSRDLAMVTVMLLGGLRRCEVLGLRLRDVDVATRRLFIAEGKGGRQRHVNVSGRFFTALADYLDREARHRHRPGLPRPQGPPTRATAVGLRPRRGPRLRPPPRGSDPRQLPRAPSHLPDPTARGRHVAGGRPGPSRARLDRDDPDLSASGRRLAR